MWKKTISLLLVFVMLLSSTVPSYAMNTTVETDTPEASVIVEEQESDSLENNTDINSNMIQDTTTANMEEGSQPEPTVSAAEPEIDSSEAEPGIVDSKNEPTSTDSADEDYEKQKLAEAEAQAQENPFTMASRTFGLRSAVAQSSSNVTYSGNYMYNDYLSIYFGSSDGFSIGTQEGNPASATDNEKMLLFCWPSGTTSNWKLSVGGSVTRPGGTSSYNNGVMTIAGNYNGINYAKTFRFVKSKTTGNEDVAEISMTVTNNGSVSQNVGARIAFDTDVAGNDSAPFYIASKGKFNTGLKLSGNDIPQYWQAMDNLSSPTVLAQGTFYQQTADKPDQVIFGRYGSLCGSNSLTPDVSVGSSNGDSAVSAAWFEKELAPGESRTYTTWLGVGEMSQEISKEITLSVNAVQEGTVSNGKQSYEPVEVASYIQNNGTSSLSNLKAQIALPDGLSLQEGEEITQTVNSLSTGGTATASWHLVAQPAETGAEYTYTVKILDSDGNILASVSKNLKMPVLDLVSPVLSGTAQVKNRASASAEIQLPTASDGNGVKAYHVVCEELNLNQVIDAAGAKTVSGKISDRITGLSENKTYDIQITAEDIYGNMSEAQTVQVSALAPTLNADRTAVLGGRKTDAVLKATAQLEDPQAVCRAVWKRVSGGTETPLEVTVSGNTSKTLTAKWDISALESGEYAVTFSVTDRDGGTAQKTITCTVDNTPPSAVTSVIAQEDYTSIRLSWNIASEYKVNSYKVYRGLDSDHLTLYATVSGRNTVSYEDTDVTADTVYFYYVTAVDKYDMESEPSDVVQGTLKKDEEVPQVTSLTPASGKTFAGKAGFSAKAQDNVGVDSVEIQYRQGSSGEWISLKTANGDSCTAELDTTSLPDGKFQVRAIAVDTSGNVSGGTPVYTYTADNTGPSKVTDLSYTSTSTTITLAWKYVQENDFDHFVVEEKQNDSFVTLTTVNKTLGVNLNVKPKSSHVYRVYAVDKVGNKGEVSEEISASAKVDTTAPVVSAISPNAGYKNKDFTVTFTMKDDDAVTKANIQVSKDKTNWTTVEEQTLNAPSNSVNVSYRVRVADYEDGSIYIRAIPEDASGNQGDSNNATAPYVQYIIDRIPPVTPSGLTVSASGRSLCIKWDNDINGETESYQLLRSDSQNGNYSVLASNIKAISYYDRSANADVTYWYKIQGRDSVGNWSEESAPVSGSWTNSNDTEKPQILSISPASESKLGGTSKTISILAQDDQVLSKIEAVYQKDGLLIDGQKHTVTVNGNDSYYLQGIVTPDLSLYDSGDKLKVTVIAYDANENQSDAVVVSYTVDTTAPSISDLKVDNSENDAAPMITWKSGENSEDLNGYYIYRSANNGSSWMKIGTRGKRSDGNYSFEDALSSSGTYIYKVTAIDLTGNQSETVSDSITYRKPVSKRTVASFTTDNQQQQNVEYLFDASESYADDGLESYLFDFGDGTTSEQMQAIHKYEQTGTYTVTLTVTDATGKTATASQIVEVKERASLGTLTVSVVNDSGVPVSNAPVYFDMESDSQTIKYTNGSGKVAFTNVAGSYKIGSYLDQYLPVTKQVIISGGSNRSVELILVNQPIVTGEFEVNRMTLEEIKAAGINIADPANQNCIQMKVRLVYGEYSKEISYTYNGSGTILGGSNSVVINDKRFVAIPFTDSSILYGGNGSGSGGSGGGSGNGGGAFEQASKVVAVMELPVEASGLKEFFDVKLHILNNASEEFSLTENMVSLNVPEGLTLMPQSKNHEVETKDELPGQNEWTLSWILRGDKKGEYDLSADYNGTLAGFNASVAATFKTDQPIKVYGMDAYKVIMDINSSILYGGLYFNLGLQNVSDVDMYMPTIDIADQIITLFELSKGEEEKPSVTVRNVSVTNSSGYTKYLGNKGTVDTLSAGETLTKQYLLYNAVTSTDITYLRDVGLKVADDLGIQIEINYVNMDLFSSENADQKFESIITDDAKKTAYSYLLDDQEFYYYQQALKDDNLATYLGQKLYSVSNAVIKLDWDAITHEKEKDITRQYIYELLQDESFQQAVDAKIDNTYLKTTKAVISDIKGMLASDMSDYVCDGWDLDDVNAVLNETNNIQKLSAALKTGGREEFKDRLRIMLGSAIGASGAKLVQELLEQDGFLIHSYNEGMLGLLNGFSAETKKILGELGDTIGTVNTVITAWNDSVELTNQLVSINAAQEQALLLTDLILQNELIKDTHAYEEVQSIHDQLIEGFNKQQTNFISEVQKAVIQNDLTSMFINDLIVGSVDKIFFANAAYGVGTVLTTIRAVYSAADYIFGWEQTANVYTTLRVSAYLSLAIQDSTQKAKIAAYSGGEEERQKFLNALKYLIKVRLVGERAYVKLLSEYTGMDKDYKGENALKVINEEKEQEFETLDEYYLWFKAMMLGYRDNLYDEIPDSQEQPEAPQVTIDFIRCRTNEQFNQNYEYSYDNATWKTCGTLLGESYISLAPKSVGRILYVRRKESESSRVGKTAAVRIKAQRSLGYAVFAGKLGEYSVIRGLKKDCDYQVVRAESDDANAVDWTNAVVQTSDENGQLVAQVGTNGDYIFYRLPADSEQFASVAHSIAIDRNVMVKITASVQGNGNVQCNDSNFTSRILAHDETLTLKAVYDKETVGFLGWYQGEELYSKRETLELDATQDLDLTAKFEDLPEYTLTVTAEEGGTVSGGGTARKGQKLTVRAVANTGYTFYGWKDAEGKLVSVNSTRTVTMMQDLSLTAVFEKLPAANICISMSVQQIEGMQEPKVTVSVGEDVRGDVTPTQSFETTSIQNTPVTVSAEDTEDAFFDSWRTETGTVVSTDKIFTFRAEEYTHYIAVYKVQGQSVTFVSAYGDIQSSKQYTSSATAESITLADGITRIGYDFIGWRIGNTTYNIATDADKETLKNAILTEIKAGRDVILNAVYEQQIQRYTVTVLNGTGGGTYDSNTAVTVTANAPQTGMNFAGWYDGDTLLTTNRSYSFYVLADRTLTAKYTAEEVEEVGTTRIESVNCNRNTKKISFISMSSVPTSCKIEKAGIIATSDAQIGSDESKFTAAAAAYVRYGTTSYKNYRYTWTKGKVVDGQVWYVRAYLVYTDANGNSHTVYGSTVKADLNGKIN